ncbi:histidinol-phosphatase [Candidatus Poribacteria bacterium]|nr:histidinol-phosphatase [Candidatus Poribacteria bacterium]
MIKIDYHTHHYRCGHARGTIEDYICKAIELGLEEIGISDHSPLYFREGNDPGPGSAMAKHELPEYVDEVLALREKYRNRIIVRLGMESDYIENMEDEYAVIYAQYPFDYLIGSVHFFDGRHIYDRRRWERGVNVEAAYREYFRLVRKSAKSGIFDVLGHITAVKAYSPKIHPKILNELYEETLGVIAEYGCCVEINTSGYRKTKAEPFPDYQMIEKCVDYGIPLTFGSDCHDPSEVTHSRVRVESLLREYGITELLTFDQRNRVSIVWD